MPLWLRKLIEYCFPNAAWVVTRKAFMVSHWMPLEKQGKFTGRVLTRSVQDLKWRDKHEQHRWYDKEL
jgi:hypothetical protein